MTDIQIFILCILGLIAIVGIHRRTLRLKLVRQLLKEGKSADEIAKIVKAYRSENG